MPTRPRKNVGPRARESFTPQGPQLNMDLKDYQISFDKAAFSALVRSQGIRMTHFRAIPDPTGMTSRGDNRSPLASGRSSDGFIYKEAGIATAFFSNNSKSAGQSAETMYSTSTAYFTFPDTYDNCDQPVLMNNWDRLYLSDIEVRVVTSQFVESNYNGLDKLNFPATCVEALFDAAGNEYREKIDFDITPEGHIKWLTQYRPGWNVELNRGTVYSIRYRYTPFFVVNRLIHEIRVAQITNPATAARSIERMPYQVEAVREHVFLDVNRDENSSKKDDPRYQQAPAYGNGLLNID